MISAICPSDISFRSLRGPSGLRNAFGRIGADASQGASPRVLPSGRDRRMFDRSSLSPSGGRDAVLASANMAQDRPRTAPVQACVLGRASGALREYIAPRGAIRWLNPSGECMVWLQGRLRVPSRQYHWTYRIRLRTDAGGPTASADGALESFGLGRIYRGSRPRPPRPISALRRNERTKRGRRLRPEPRTLHESTGPRCFGAKVQWCGGFGHHIIPQSRRGRGNQHLRMQAEPAAAHGETNAFGRRRRRAHPACNETHAFGHGGRSMRREGGNRTFGIGGDPSNPHRERPTPSGGGWNRSSQHWRRTALSGTEGNQRAVPAETGVFGQRRKRAHPHGRKPTSSGGGGRPCNALSETRAFGQRRNLEQPAPSGTGVFGQWENMAHRRPDRLMPIGDPP